MPARNEPSLKKPWSSATSKQRPDLGLKRRWRRADFIAARVRSQLLDGDVAELHEARGGDVFAVGLPAAVVLERELARRGHVGELRVFDHGLAVEHDGEAV